MSHSESLATIQAQNPIDVPIMELGQRNEQANAEKNGHSRLGKLMAIGLAVGVGSVVGLVSEVADRDTPEAHADYRCPVPDYLVIVDIKDANGNYVGSLTEGWCYDKPAPTPTNPPAPNPTTPPSGGSGGNSGGTGNTTPRATTPATTSPFIEVNQDGDSWSITINKNTGETASGWDIDDNSPGLGEEGLAILQSEMQSRGLDVNSLTDTQRLIAQTVHPDQWSAYLSEIFNVAVTTTTTIPETTSTTTIPETTTTELENDTTTVLEVTESTEPAVVLPVDVNNDSGSGESSNNLFLPIGLTTLAVVLAAGGFLIARHRRREDDEAGDFTGHGTSPVAGN